MAALNDVVRSETLRVLVRSAIEQLLNDLFERVSNAETQKLLSMGIGDQSRFLVGLCGIEEAMDILELDLRRSEPPLIQVGRGP